MNTKEFIPLIILDFYQKIRYKKNRSRFYQIDYWDVFDIIYRSNLWNDLGNRSGPGSRLAFTNNAISGIQKIIGQFSIQSILDLPCGDFYWMQKVNLENVNYLGADIVIDLISNNQEQFAKNHIGFANLDLISDSLPKADLMINRDCLVHFSYKDIFSAVQNILNSEIEYLLTTTFTKLTLNFDIVTGDWRPINLERPPFNFPKPSLLIKENVDPEHARAFRGKSLALWETAKLRHSLRI